MNTTSFMDPIRLEPGKNLRVGAGERVCVFSDLHLGDGSAGDLFVGKDDLFLQTLEREAARADVVVLAGDICDHVQAFTHRRIRRAHLKVMQAIEALPGRCRAIYVLGNHERRVVVRRQFPGYEVAEALQVGEDALVLHGHQLDIHFSEGRRSRLGVHMHSLLERLLRSPIRLPYRDYGNPVNGVAHRLFFWWTRWLMVHALVQRMLKHPEAFAHWQRIDNYWARGQWGDLGALFESARAYLEQPGCPWRVLVMGHSHQPGVVELGQRLFVNTGSWAFDDCPFLRLGQGRPRLLDALTMQEIRQERYELFLSNEELPDMAGWFKRYYRGFFRYDWAGLFENFPHAAGS